MSNEIALMLMGYTIRHHYKDIDCPKLPIVVVLKDKTVDIHDANPYFKRALAHGKGCVYISLNLRTTVYEIDTIDRIFVDGKLWQDYHGV